MRGEVRDPRDRLIVALDVPTAGDVETLAAALEGEARWFKVGLELYAALGAWAVRFLTGRGFHVMLDLKLHDIPRTVERAVRALAGSGVELLTVHASGGEAMIAAAAGAARDGAGSGLPHPRVLAVTVLTSLDDGAARTIFGASRAADRVLSLAELARGAGADGVVAAPQEAAAIRRMAGPEFLIVTPGIRSTPLAEGDDQRRTATAAEAARVADYLVIGRPVVAAPDPRAAFVELAASLQGETWPGSRG